LTGLAILLVFFLLGRRLFAGKKTVDSEAGLKEKLVDYPPPPGLPGARRLTVEGEPARLRLIVAAPVGRGTRLTPNLVEQLLDQVVRGLTDIAKADRPRVRIWPPQLSQKGFAMTFHRLTQKPEPDGKASRWVLLAGQAQPGPQKLLLGLALLADESNVVGRLTLEPEQWADVLAVK